MIQQKPLLLLSNDDGVNAKGINELIKALRPLGELIVMAPDGPRSGSSCAITTTTPLRCNLVRKEPGLTIYKCSGTPTDCVKLALHTFVPRKPDLVIGGINHGDNSSVNVHYSGTMGVVIEGCLKGIPSVGFSLCNQDPDADFTPTQPYIRRIASEVLSNGLPYGICLNVNFPNTAEIKGVKICRQTDGVWTNELQQADHPNFNNYFWMVGEYKNLEPEAEETDHWAMDNGYAAITPTQVDVTAYQVMDKLKSWNFDV